MPSRETRTAAPPEVLSAAAWAGRAEEFEELERHPTCGAGELVILRDASGYAAVERPGHDLRVLRRFPDAAAMRRFVDERMAQYERMWNGCGCRIDYFA